MNSSGQLPDSHSQTVTNEDHFNAVLAEYLGRLDAGEKIDQEALIKQHPDLADLFREFFRGSEQVERMAGDFLTSQRSVPSKVNQSAVTQLVAECETILPTPGTVPTEGLRNSEGGTPLGDFGRYRLKKVLGQGAMGTVYLAEDTQLDRQVALKIPKFFETQSPDTIARFYREAKAAATILNPNICPVYDVGEIDGTHFISMAYITGRQLSDFIQGDSLPTSRQVMTVLRKVALALDEAHRQGIIHRDLKPDNIMIDQRGDPVIMDFGLARRINKDDARITRSGAIVGSPAYMSPEQLTGNPDDVVPASDIYSLGVILYELLTGQIPFRGGIAAVIAQILSDEPKHPTLVRPGVDPGLEAICLKMMAKKTSNRFATMRDVAEAINQLIKSPSREPAPQAKPAQSKTTPAKPAAVEPSKRVPDPAPAKQAPLAKSPEITESSVAALLATAEELCKQHSYDEAIQLLNAISNKRHTPESRELLEKVQALSQEIAELKVAIEYPVLVGEEAAFEKKLKRLLELQPQNRQARKLWVQCRPADKRDFPKPIDGLGVMMTPGGSGFSWISQPFLIAGGLAASLLMFAIVIYFQSGKTTVKLVIEDPSLKVEFAGESFTIHSEGKSISVKPETQSLTVSYEGSDGLKVETKNFEVKKGRKNLITVSVVDGRVVLTENDTVVQGGGGSPPNFAKASGNSLDIKSPPPNGNRRSAVEMNSSLDSNRHAPIRPITDFNSLAFQQWFKDVQAMSAEKQVDAVAKKLMELNPGFDGRFTDDSNRIQHGVVERLSLNSDFVTDLSPVRAITTLKALHCAGSQRGKGALQDLSPLRGMNLSEASFENNSNLTDLSPLAGMPLKTLTIRSTNVSDLEPLRGISLTSFDCVFTAVSGLAPLSGMKLESLEIGGTPISDMSVIQGMPLRRLNLFATKISNLSSVRGMTTLKSINFSSNEIEDMVPLSGLELDEIDLSSTKVTDLSPLRSMHLRVVFCSSVNISNLQVLKGMPIDTLFLMKTPVNDLSPLHGMPLRVVNIESSKVSDLSVLKATTLKHLQIAMTDIADLTPLRGLDLVEIGFSPEKIHRGIETVREMKTIENIGPGWLQLFPPKEFWKKYDAGEFGKSAIPTRPITEFNSPAFQQWMKDVQAMPAEEQLETVSKKLIELNPGFDGNLMGANWQTKPKIRNGVVTEVWLRSDDVTDLSPVRAFVGLKVFACSGSSPSKSRLSDLMPLKGLALTTLYCKCKNVTDLSPLQGMPLKALYCEYSSVVDLSPLKGMPLETLWFESTKVTDVSTLERMNLKRINLTPRNITRGMEVIRQMKSLQMIGTSGLADRQYPSEEFWRKYDAGEFGKPTTVKPITDFNTLTFQQWMKDVQALPAEKQVEAVSKKLQELNLGFDGKVTDIGWDGNSKPKIENGVVTQLGFFTNKVTDVSPVRALSGLKALEIRGGGHKDFGRLSDLSPLEGTHITDLMLSFNPISDLSPLAGLTLTSLHISETHVDDLSPLQGMRLTALGCGATPVRDLSPLKGMPLDRLWCYGTQISDLSPLTGMPLEFLAADRIPSLSDLSPLRGLPLRELVIYGTPVSDVSPLQGMKMARISFTPKDITKGMDVLRTMNSLQKIGSTYEEKDVFLPAEFWKKYDAGEFGKPAP